jgi:predicted SAM-dependent methyltransferase
MKTPLKYLNVGCGNRFHPDWVNIDVVAQGKEVIEHNILKGLPFGDAEFDVVYHSHVIEHLPKQMALPFLQECHRVLKKGGIIRIAFPDLEAIAGNYVKALEEVANQPDAATQCRYKWMQLELMDQMVRNHSGGDMKLFLQDSNQLADKAFVIGRCGEEVQHIMQAASAPKSTLSTKISKFLALSTRTKWRLVADALADVVYGKILLWGKYRQAYQTGRFRNGGEVHQWMYDRYSIAALLSACGFSDITVRDGFSSQVKDWNTFRLDSVDGRVLKPDSMFVEAIKR